MSTRARVLALVALALPAYAHAEDGGLVDASVVRDAGALDASTIDAGVTDAGARAADAGPPVGRLPEPPPGHEPLVASERSPSGDVHVGDLVTWTIRATIPEGDDLDVPRQRFRALEVRRRTVVPEGATSGTRTFVIKLELIALEAGEHTVGPLKLTVVTADGTIGQTEVAGIRVRVRSLLGNEPNAQPKPATQPVVLIEEDPTLKYIGGFLLAMLAGAAVTLLVRRWWQRRPKVLPPPPPPRPVGEVALEKLDVLRRDRVEMMERGEASAWVDGLSDAIRAYLGGRYGFDGLESTSDEVIAYLRNARLGTLAMPEIETFLGDCDLAKFASIEPSDEHANSMLERAYRIVRATMVAPVTPSSVRVSAPPTGGAS